MSSSSQEKKEWNAFYLRAFAKDATFTPAEIVDMISKAVEAKKAPILVVPFASVVVSKLTDHLAEEEKILAAKGASKKFYEKIKVSEEHEYDYSKVYKFIEKNYKLPVSLPETNVDDDTFVGIDKQITKLIEKYDESTDSSKLSFLKILEDNEVDLSYCENNEDIEKTGKKFNKKTMDSLIHCMRHYIEKTQYLSGGTYGIGNCFAVMISNNPEDPTDYRWLRNISASMLVRGIPMNTEYKIGSLLLNEEPSKNIADNVFEVIKSIPTYSTLGTRFKKELGYREATYSNIKNSNAKFLACTNNKRFIKAHKEFAKAVSLIDQYVPMSCFVLHMLVEQDDSDDIVYEQISKSIFKSYTSMYAKKIDKKLDVGEAIGNKHLVELLDAKSFTSMETFAKSLIGNNLYSFIVRNPQFFDKSTGTNNMRILTVLRYLYTKYNYDEKQQGVFLSVSQGKVFNKNKGIEEHSLCKNPNIEIHYRGEKDIISNTFYAHISADDTKAFARRGTELGLEDIVNDIIDSQTSLKAVTDDKNSVEKNPCYLIYPSLSENLFKEYSPHIKALVNSVVSKKPSSKSDTYKPSVGRQLLQAFYESMPHYNNNCALVAGDFSLGVMLKKDEHSFSIKPKLCNEYSDEAVMVFGKPVSSFEEHVDINSEAQGTESPGAIVYSTDADEEESESEQQEDSYDDHM